MRENKKIDLAIFDMDGTVFTSNINWKNVKKRLNVNGTSILEKIYEGDRIDKNSLKYLEKIEEKSVLVSEPLPGALDFTKKIAEMGIKTSLVTNNSRKNSEYLLEKYKFTFDTVITRDDNMWKPSPSAFNYLLSKFRISPENTISIGDSDFDVTASVKAYISDVYIVDSAVINGEYPIEINYFRDYKDLYSIIFRS